MTRVFLMLRSLLLCALLTGAALGQGVLPAGTYLGGAGRDGNYDVKVVEAADGSVYVAAPTLSTDLVITPDAFQPALAGSYDLIVARFSAGLDTLLAATYLGGSTTDATWPGVDLALGPDGTVYVTSAVRSLNWPTTPGAFKTTYTGGYDLAVARLSPGLDQLLASTYLGGSMDEDFPKLVCTPGGDVIVVCHTMSTNFPTTAGTLSPARVGNADLGLARLSADLSTLVAGSYLGSTLNDWPEVIALDSDGDIYLTGWTDSGSFPTTAGAFQTTNVGTYQAFVSRLSGDLTTLEASTLIGGAKWEFGYGLALAPSGDVYACGHTASTDFPVTAGCFQPEHSGDGVQGVDDEIWIACFDHDLTTLQAATYLGGNGWENGVALVVTAQGLMVGGTTSSTDWPVTAAALDTTASGGGRIYVCDMTLTLLDAGLTTVLASTYLGGDGVDDLGGLWPAPDGGVWVVGSTSSSDLPLPPQAWDATYAGGDFDWGGDVVVARLGADLGPLDLSAAPRAVPERRLSVMGASPNPFNPLTEVAFHLAQAAPVRVSVHDTAGRQVALLADGPLAAGHHALTWNGTDAAGRAVASGVYLVRLVSGDQRRSLKVVLLK